MTLLDALPSITVIGILLRVELECGPMGRPKQATRDGRREYCPKAFNKGGKTKTSPGMGEKKNKAGEFSGVATLPTTDRGCVVWR